jgi:hypothetical protein
MTEKEELLKAIRLLGLWATCFDYKRYTQDIADSCSAAESLIEEYIEEQSDLQQSKGDL